MRVVALMVVLVAFAGCVETEADPIEPATTEEVAETEVVPEFGPHSGLPLERPADFTPSLSAAPEWVLGEWWTIEVTDGFVGKTHTITRIVAGKEGPDYLVGMPIEEFNDEVMILHFPGHGLIQKATLGVEAHDAFWAPLQFPLVEGDEWNSLWEGQTRTVTHTVTAVDAETMTADVIQTGSQAAEYTYDAELGVISDFVAPGYIEWRVVDHGFDYEGTVRVPHSHDLIFFNGAMGPVGIAGGGVAPTTPGALQTVTVPDLYDRTSFSLIAFEVGLLLGPTAGLFPKEAGRSVTDLLVTAPDGTEFHLQKLPTEQGHKIESYAHPNPEGDWQVQVAAGGATQAFIEGIGYVTFDVVLPEGCVIVTEKVHDHGGVCGGHVHDIE